jgi:hypothetical protein
MNRSTAASRKNDFQWGLRRVRKINRAEAKRQHLMIVEPAPNELQIDLDGARAIHRYGMSFVILKRAGLTRGWQETIEPSRKPGHVHLTVTLPFMVNRIERVCLQSLLASDHIRECFNYIRVKRRNRYPIVFFEKEKP